MKDPNNLLVQKEDGKFAEAGGTSGVGSGAVSRGAALPDFNLDGLVDLVVVNRWETAQVWRNTTASPNHWIEIKLAQPESNRDAIGAWLEMKIGDRIMRREITSGGGHASGQAGFWHMGLGAMDKALLRVIWPDGEAGEWQELPADSFYMIERGKAAVPIEIK
jgi:enediyne biosynthesis protein E4